MRPVIQGKITFCAAKEKTRDKKTDKKMFGAFLAKEIFIRKFQLFESGKILDQILRQIYAFVENEMKDIARKSKERKIKEWPSLR